jgi:outer membrane protein assembly factor BamE
MPVNHRSLILTGLLVTACALLTACTSISNATANISAHPLNPTRWVTPYRADVVQGNFISREQVAQLRAGMSRTDVRNVLGTPLVASVFHADRWDYVFTLRRQGVPEQSFNYSLIFKGDVLASFAGDTMPSETEFIAKMDQRRQLGKVPSLEATPAQLAEAAKKMPPVVPPANPDTARAQAPAASYPPLEGPRQ